MSGSQPTTQPVPQVVAGRYRVVELIGRGGRASVYAAEDPLLHRQVAVKVFRATAESTAELELQEAEARLIAGMNHYALTTLFDAGVDTTAPRYPRIYLVMERIPGLDLKRHLAQEGALSAAQVAYLGFDMAEGLQYVHEHGFLHRDIKPANILLADRRMASRIRGKLADFGIASIIGMPDSGEFTTGTAAYLSPEQVNGDAPTPASDVYALGLVLLEAVTGTLAYPGSVEDSALARLDRDPEIPKTVPPRLRTILRRMTALEPQDRPELAEVALAFQRAYVEDLADSHRMEAELLTAGEEQRLAAVRRYNVLDTPPEDAFDDITAMAARVLAVPIAAVSIVDADRVWFKSRRNWVETELDRGTAFWTTGATESGAWSIPDLLADARTRDNPLVTHGPKVRAYAAAPLRTRDGHDLGALCVFDQQARRFSEEDLLNLSALADVIMRELELRLASRRALFNR